MLEFAREHQSIYDFPVNKLLQILSQSSENRVSKLKAILESISKTKELFNQAAKDVFGDTLLIRRRELMSGYEQLIKEYFVEASRAFANDPAYQKFKKDRQARHVASGLQSQT